MEQERGLCKDDRLFRDPAFPRTVKFLRILRSISCGLKGRSRRNRPFCEAYFEASAGPPWAIAPACIALLRCMAHAPLLPLSRASCACAIFFFRTVLPLPSGIVFTVPSVFSKFGLLEPT